MIYVPFVIYLASLTLAGWLHDRDRRKWARQLKAVGRHLKRLKRAHDQEQVWANEARMLLATIANAPVPIAADFVIQQAKLLTVDCRVTVEVSRMDGSEPATETRH
jgi:hypothetical protein